jgi:hypothetical protein
MPVVSLIRTQRQRTAAFALLGTGGATAAAGWLSVSGSSTPREQLSYLVSAGLGSLLCLGLGLTLLLEAGLRDEVRTLAELGGQAPSAETGFGYGGALAVLVAGGLAAAIVGLGWNQAAAASDERSAVPGLTIGMAGLILLAVAAAATLLRTRAAVEGRKVVVLRPLAERYQATVVTVDVTGPGLARPDGRMVFVAPGLTRFHTADCPTLTDVDANAVERRQVDPRLRPCQICEAATQ